MEPLVRMIYDFGDDWPNDDSSQAQIQDWIYRKRKRNILPITTPNRSRRLGPVIPELVTNITQPATMQAEQTRASYTSFTKNKPSGVQDKFWQKWKTETGAVHSSQERYNQKKESEERASQANYQRRRAEFQNTEFRNCNIRRDIFGEGPDSALKWDDFDKAYPINIFQKEACKIIEQITGRKTRLGLPCWSGGMMHTETHYSCPGPSCKERFLTPWGPLPLAPLRDRTKPFSHMMTWIKKHGVQPCERCLGYSTDIDDFIDNIRKEQSLREILGLETKEKGEIIDGKAIDSAYPLRRGTQVFPMCVFQAFDLAYFQNGSAETVESTKVVRDTFLRRYPKADKFLDEWIRLWLRQSTDPYAGVPDWRPINKADGIDSISWEIHTNAFPTDTKSPVQPIDKGRRVIDPKIFVENRERLRKFTQVVFLQGKGYRFRCIPNDMKILRDGRHGMVWELHRRSTRESTSYDDQRHQPNIATPLEPRETSDLWRSLAELTNITEYQKKCAEIDLSTPERCTIVKIYLDTDPAMILTEWDSPDYNPIYDLYFRGSTKLSRSDGKDEELEDFKKPTADKDKEIAE
ncbi:MAG: hypothetical protein NZ842_01025, partial [Dehalococcoidia bacterium]|nr:hypothetical protein [Dehalococcoidia bacterium]